MIGILLMTYYLGLIEAINNDNILLFIKNLPKPIFNMLKQQTIEEIESGKCINCGANNNCPLQDIANGKFDNIAATDTAT